MLDFDIPDVPASKAQRLWKLQEFLARTHHQNRFAVLVIDEAHKLGPDVLEEIRLLGNFESAADKFLQILLLGQSELDDLLKRQDLRQFKQRIALRLYIDPLSTSEVYLYIRFRWAKAGGRDAPPFTPDALTAVAQWSQSIPRLINSICDSALLMAYADESPGWLKLRSRRGREPGSVGGFSSLFGGLPATVSSVPFPSDLAGMSADPAALPAPPYGDLRRTRPSEALGREIRVASLGQRTTQVFA